MSPLVALGRLTDSDRSCWSGPRPGSQAPTVKRHVSRAHPLPVLGKASHGTSWPQRRLLSPE
jgi:hypothetical protein